MKEVKSPKKPLIYYYCIVLLIIFLFNLLVTPLLTRGQVTEVDYGTFMEMTQQKQIGAVQVEDSQILFTDKEGLTVYKTAPMEDPNLTQRLYDSGAEFTRVIEEPISPIWSFLLTFILPLVIFALHCWGKTPGTRNKAELPGFCYGPAPGWGGLPFQ